MALDRSKFKSSSVAQLTQDDKDLNKNLGKKERISSNGHELDEGSNLLRLYPVHPDAVEADANASWVVPFVQTFLPAIVQEKDKQGVVIKDNKGNPKTKESVKPVYNAVIHAKGVTKDIVTEYIKLAGDWAKKNLKSEDDRKAFLEPIYGNYGKKINGITYPSKWVVYADKYPNANGDATPSFDRFFFKKSVKERLNVISQMETKGDPLGTDPFTDTEEGRAIEIFVNPDGDAKNYYTTELDSTTTTERLSSGKMVKVAKQYPLSDAQLEKFMGEKSLQELYSDCAGRKNFEAQLAGLELFDSKNQMGIFELPEWDKIVIEIDGFYPEEGEAETKNTDADEDIVEEDEEEEDNTDEFDLLNRQELQAYAKREKTGILVKPSISDSQLRDLLRTWLAASEPLTQEPLPNDDDFVEGDEPEVLPVAKKSQKQQDKDNEDFLAEMSTPVKATFVEEVEEAPKKETATVSSIDRLAALRAKNKARA